MNTDLSLQQTDTIEKRQIPVSKDGYKRHLAKYSTLLMFQFLAMTIELNGLLLNPKKNR